MTTTMFCSSTYSRVVVIELLTHQAKSRTKDRADKVLTALLEDKLPSQLPDQMPPTREALVVTSTAEDKMLE